MTLNFQFHFLQLPPIVFLTLTATHNLQRTNGTTVITNHLFMISFQMLGRVGGFYQFFFYDLFRSWGAHLNLKVIFVRRKKIAKFWKVVEILYGYPHFWLRSAKSALLFYFNFIFLHYWATVVSGMGKLINK